MIDKIRIEETLTYITQRLLLLDKAIVEFNSSKSDISLSASERYMEQIVGSLFKINDILLEEKDEIAGSYKEGFLLIGKIYSIKKEFTSDIANIAKFRNYLAHEYMDLIPEETIKEITLSLTTIKLYLKEIKKILENN
jgi:uncharacterized protein YutE (UPF0331/DUF86 family)